MNAQTNSITASGWIDHDGSQCPLPWSTMVQVRFADGTEPKQVYAAGFWAQYWTPGLDSAGKPRDCIVAYRFAFPLTDVVNLGRGRIAA